MTNPQSLDSAIGAEIVLSGRRYLNFGGSAYLGLGQLPGLLEAGAAALRKRGPGPGFAGYLGIDSEAHACAERSIRHLFGSDDALFLASGYHFALAALPVLTGQQSRIFYDELIHAALKDGIVLSARPRQSYAHCDPDDLARHIRNTLAAGEIPLVVTDGLFSTAGQIAPVNQLQAVAHEYGGRLLVDESHSFGTLGETGRGVCEMQDLSDTGGIIRGGSTGKAFGVCGGIIPAARADATALRGTNIMRGAAPGMAASAAMVAHALDHLRTHPELLERLRRNVRQMKTGLGAMGLAVGNSDAPIASFALGSRDAMASLRDRLLEHGIYVYHSTYNCLDPKGVIRCGIFADHEPEQISEFLDVLRALV